MPGCPGDGALPLPDPPIAPADRWGPFAAGLDEAERRARLRSMRATAVAAAVYVEMHRAHADALRHVDPTVRRALGLVIRREVENALRRARP